MGAGRRLASLTDLVAAENAGLATEIVDGELVEKAKGTALHGHAQGMVRFWLDPYRRRGSPPGGWWILTEVTVALDAEHVYRPDVSGWRRERLPALPAEFPVTVAPDWVCEVLSASTARRDLGPKQRHYHRSGVGHYWVVDPERLLLTVLRRVDAGYVTVLVAGPGERVRAEPFDEVEIDIDELFARE